MSGPPGCCGTLRQAPTWPASLRSAGARPRPRSSAHTTHHSVTSYTLPRITSQQSPGVLCCATSFRLNVRPPATPASDASRAPAFEGSPSGGIVLGSGGTVDGAWVWLVDTVPPAADPF